MNFGENYMNEHFKIISVFIAGFFAAFFGPYIKSLFDKHASRKNPKIQNAHEVYEELIYYLIQGKTSDTIELSRLKSKLLAYGKDDVIQLATKYISIKIDNAGNQSYQELYTVINKIRDELKMGSNFDKEILKTLIELKN